MNSTYYNDDKRNETHPVAAGILGAVAGAAVGIAMASILSDPQKRKIVGKQMQDLQTWGNKTLKDLREKTLNVEDTLTDQAMSAASKAEKIQKELEEAGENITTKTK